MKKRKSQKSAKKQKYEPKKAPGTFQVYRASAVAIGLFILYAAIGFWLLYNPFVARNFSEPFTGFVAGTAGWLFRIFGADTAGSGTVLSVGGTSFSIAFGCNGLEALVIYIAALLSSPFTWKSKIGGLVVGFVGNYIINQIRIIGLFLAAMIGDQEFQYAHTIVGQTFVIVLTMAIFLWWGSRYGQRKKARSRAVLA